VRAAKLLPLYQREDDVVEAFWSKKTASIEVLASFLGPITSVVDVRYAIPNHPSNPH